MITWWIKAAPLIQLKTALDIRAKKYFKSLTSSNNCFIHKFIAFEGILDPIQMAEWDMPNLTCRSGVKLTSTFFRNPRCAIALLQSFDQIRYYSSDPRLGRLIVDEYATFRDSYRELKPHSQSGISIIYIYILLLFLFILNFHPQFYMFYVWLI